MKFGESVILENKSLSLLKGGIAHKVAAIGLSKYYELLFTKDKHKIQKTTFSSK